MSCSKNNGLLRSLHLERESRKRIKTEHTTSPSVSSLDWTPGNYANNSNISIDCICMDSSRRDPKAVQKEFVVLSYNLWFNESAAVVERMGAIGSIIKQKKPDVVCLQEVTYYILDLLRSHSTMHGSWLSEYYSSVESGSVTLQQPPYFTMLLISRKFSSNNDNGEKGCIRFKRLDFPGSIMGRDLLYTSIFTGAQYPGIIVATTHLESPTPPQFHIDERKRQLADSFNFLEGISGDSNINVVFAGDMNWLESRSGKVPGDGDVQFPVSCNALDAKQSSFWCDCWLQYHSRSMHQSQLGTISSVTNKRSNGDRHVVKRTPLVSDDRGVEIINLLSDSESDSESESEPLVSCAQATIPAGFTFDTVTNPMLKGHTKLQGRFDRCFCKLRTGSGLSLSEVSLIGCKPVLDCNGNRITYRKLSRGKEIELPVLPSDHYGLIVKFNLAELS